MLHEFLETNQAALIGRCRDKVAERTTITAVNHVELPDGIPMLIDQLVALLKEEALAGRGSSKSGPTQIGASAARHGTELYRKGFTIDQVVHDYGDLCQAVTELAHERQEPITVEEFHTFNRCLDIAIANAVTEYSTHRDAVVAGEGARTVNERLGMLAYELRHLVSTATLAHAAIKGGHGAVGGATGGVLGHCLDGLRKVLDRTLVDVRLTAGLMRPQAVALEVIVEEASVAARLEANVRKIGFGVAVEHGLSVVVDRESVSSALSNLLQNALEFSHAGGEVSVTGMQKADRVLVEVADRCGGLPAGRLEEITSSLGDAGTEPMGVGLGLSISRRAIEANAGTLRVRDLPGIGCVFTIDLPRA